MCPYMPYMPVLFPDREVGSHGFFNQKKKSLYPFSLQLPSTDFNLYTNFLVAEILLVTFYYLKLTLKERNNKGNKISRHFN